MEGGPPRQRWGCDFYGVENGNILGMIDLDSLWVELRFTKDRSASSVEAIFRDSVVFRHGPPMELRSDHAREFVGTTMRQLARACGYRVTTTGGYNATGNSTMERFWGYFGMCLRGLNDDEYADVAAHLQRIAWAWNTTNSCSTTVSPFEVMTGCEPCDIPAAVSREGQKRRRLNVNRIRESAAEYIRIAKLNADHNRKLQAERLNTRGRKLKEFKVGDLVKIYKPPSQEATKRAGRKAKHLLQWVGPLRVTAVNGT